MIKLLIPFIALTVVLGACSSTEDELSEGTVDLNASQEMETQEENINDQTSDEAAEEENNAEADEIDTSVYEYAESVEVTNSIDLTKHVNLRIEMSDELTAGMASNHVLNQTFDFLQQPDIEGADTVTINVIQDETKVFQFTTTLADFKPDETTPMAKLVVEASEIDFMNPAVEEHGKIMELW